MTTTRDTSAAGPKADGEVCVPINASELIEFCYANGWSDGLPVVPPSRKLVNEALAAAGLAPQDVIARMPSRKVAVTAEKVAANAVMAGCKPEYLPVVAAAVKALAAPEFVLHHVASGLSGSTIMIVVNGPITKQLGINSTNNVFGPGVRANAAIGRALRLVLLNCLKYTPGVSDRAVMGTPGKYTCCIAENEVDHPWGPLHVERGFSPAQSTVTLIAASSMLQVWNYGNHEQLLCAIGDAQLRTTLETILPATLREASGTDQLAHVAGHGDPRRRARACFARERVVETTHTRIRCRAYGAQCGGTQARRPYRRARRTRR